jgi:hypothetical protein
VLISDGGTFPRGAKIKKSRLNNEVFASSLEALFTISSFAIELVFLDRV